MQSGRLIQDCAHSGEFNMAADIFLSEYTKKANKVVLRLYTWDRPTLSLGYHQKLKNSLLDSCTARRIPVVRRPTGGRAVLHDRELTYMITIPESHPRATRGRNELFKEIGASFITAAYMIGKTAELVRFGSEDRLEVLPKGSPLCFDSVSRWEVRLQGRKWIGSAQRFLPGVVLQHGSILLGESAVNIAELFYLQNRKTGIGSKQHYKLSQDKLRLAIPKAIKEHLNLTWELQGFTTAEIEEISIRALNDGFSIAEDKITIKDTNIQQ